MLSWANRRRSFAIAVAMALGITAPIAQAQNNAWRIAKASGEAWVTGNGVQQVSATQQTELQPGASIRTGRNGRVQLVRGAETILVAPNSAISLPEAGRPGMSTVIQQAGSILLDVEKRNVQHFEVETPYLAAVVKGTRFRVTLEGGRPRVDVVRGQVQVSDFRTGQFALVMPGQTAQASSGANAGLQLSGQGALGRVEQGAPQASRVAPLAVPRGGLGPAPGAIPVQRGSAPALNDAMERSSPASKVIERASNGSLRISAPLGEVNLDVHKATRGMAHSDANTNGQSTRRATVWSTGELNPGTRTTNSSVGNSGTAAGASETGSAGAARTGLGSSAAQGLAAANAAASQGVTQATTSRGANSNSGSNNAGGNGNGNSTASNAGGNGNGNAATSSAGGNGNSAASNAGGNGNGNSGTSNAGGNGNGNSGTSNAGGNGNGNSGNNAGGNGNGNAFGLAKNGNGNSKKD